MELITASASLAKRLANCFRFAIIWGNLAVQALANWKDANSELTLHKKKIQNLIAARKFQQADNACCSALRYSPKEPILLHLRAEIAANQKCWQLVLEHWVRLETVSKKHVGRLPVDWVFQIGLQSVLAQHAAVTKPHLYAISCLTIAHAYELQNTCAAIGYARRARGAYRDEFIELVVRVLTKEARFDAVLWWLNRAATPNEAGRRHFPRLIDALMEMADFDSAGEALQRYTHVFGHGALLVRYESEILFRRGEITDFTNYLRLEISRELPKNPGVSPLEWLYRVFENHPLPSSTLPAETVETILAFSAKHDRKDIRNKLAGLFANRGEERVGSEQPTNSPIGKTKPSTLKSASAAAQQFILRRDWKNLEALVCDVDVGSLAASGGQPVWPILRAKTDFLLGAGRVREAEETCLEFADALLASRQYRYIAQNAVALIGRIPHSHNLASMIRTAAGRVGLQQMQIYLDEWVDNFGSSPTLSHERDDVRKRCFIVGNAPSITQLPLKKLEGEVVFCVNRGRRAEAWGLPKPDYLVVADDRVFKNYTDQILHDGRTVARCFVAANCLWGKKLQSGIETFGLSGFKYTLKPLQFSPGCFHRGETVVLVAAQIACLMGFKEIFFLGVDLEYDGPQTHFYNDSKKEGQRLSNFLPGGIGAELANLAFSNLQSAIQPIGCNLYNANMGGSLHSIPRVDFTKLLDG